MGTITSRDLSALAFHARVLEEAAGPHPLMERAKFLGITYAGLEEFHRVRLPRLKGDEKRRVLERMENIYRRAEEVFLPLVDEMQLQGLRLEKACGTELPPLEEADALALPGSAMLLAMQDDMGQVRIFNLEKLPRLLSAGENAWAPVEKVAASHVKEVCGAKAVCVFRLLRDETAVPEGPGEDAVPLCMESRRQGMIQRMESWGGRKLADGLRQMLNVKKKRWHALDGMAHPGGLMRALAALPGWEEAHDPPFEPRMPHWARGDILTAIGEKDRLVIHPYDSFDPVIRLAQCAVEDPAVEKLMITLYRVKEGSHLVDALCSAAGAGKQVTVLVEKRARFDEERNLALAQRLQEAGCCVISGPDGYKVHSKIMLLARREGGSLRHYLHLGTGNYHEGTARQYTDIGLFTADEALGQDAQRFFAALAAGESPELAEMTASPWGMRQELARLIRREMSFAARGENSGITLKMNALTDPDLVSLLEEAARAGVQVDATVRGACCLRPGEGGSGHIRVRSIVGRFLEHARIFRFEAGGAGETYIASADWMKRNLDRRVELLIPVKDAQARAALTAYLAAQQRDTAKAWNLYVDDYTAARCCAGVLADSQSDMLAARIGQE